jgi:predicted nucleic acid-binding protein
MRADARDWANFDTSVLVKAYWEEPGTLEAADLLARHSLLSSVIAPIELLSALFRRRASGALNEAQVSHVSTRIERDRKRWTLIPPDAAVLERAEPLVQAGRIRTLDALHLASALVFQASSGLTIPFITADLRQREVATRAGLSVVWVG